MPVASVVVMELWVCVYLHTHWLVNIKHAQLFTCQLCLTQVFYKKTSKHHTMEKIKCRNRTDSFLNCLMDRQTS